MTISSFSPVLDPKIAERIADAVKHLEVPSDALLLQAHADIQRQVEQYCRNVQLAIEITHADALAALGHILLDESDLKSQPRKNYFDRS